MRLNFHLKFKIKGIEIMDYTITISKLYSKSTTTVNLVAKSVCDKFYLFNNQYQYR